MCDYKFTRLVFLCGSLTRFEDNYVRGVLAKFRVMETNGEGCSGKVTILMDGNLWMY